MIRQILSVLLLLCLSVPAMAGTSCHVPEPVATGADSAGCHDAKPASRDVAPLASHHDCIGCIAPAREPDRFVERVEPMPPLLRIPALSDVPAGTRAVPDTPPPRLAA